MFFQKSSEGRKRELVDKLRSDWKKSIRRACSTLRIDRALYVYKSKRGDQADLKHRIKSICEKPGCATVTGASTYCCGGSVVGRDVAVAALDAAAGLTSQRIGERRGVA
jgi:hypothetical protein